jgi:hypothetical protein
MRCGTVRPAATIRAGFGGGSSADRVCTTSGSSSRIPLRTRSTLLAPSSHAKAASLEETAPTVATRLHVLRSPARNSDARSLPASGRADANA